ncbi:hypothetical protein [Lacticaseibacillus nasuensis]|uniref:hypothetical protein n=1 Tax=Lacticaseibacillus nasuensis TaxID=944671 RepID=UPI0022464C3D|nr:hypothetical protein [Lacticaseibacillus nasuensis]MCX2455659.1 hypothetical protein [Lacticaseibacillus nasuensis]
MDLITYTAEQARQSMREAQIRAHAETVESSIMRASIANINAITVPNLSAQEQEALIDAGYTLTAGIRGWEICWTQK